MGKINVWCVMYSLKGYLPDDHMWTTTLKCAESVARQWAQECRETNNTVQGSALERFYDVGDYACIEIVLHKSFASYAERDQYIAENFG